jgi:hypothetical protein
MSTGLNRDLARLMASRRVCRCCGTGFAQLLSLEYDRPDFCPPDLPKLDNSALMVERGDVLTDDFCRVEDYRFLRCVLILPLGDGPHEMLLGVWCAVSPDHFDDYIELFDQGETVEMGPVPGWLGNSVPPGSDIPLACVLHMQDSDQRPETEITERGHRLRQMQETGLDLGDLVQMLRDFGHDLPSLMHDA